MMKILFIQLSYDTGNQPGGIVSARIKPYDSVPLLI